MAKMSMLVCLFLFVLIAMPTSSSSNVTGCRGACPTLECPNAYYVEKCCMLLNYLSDATSHTFYS
ncbi:hypothetical protein MKW92_006515 [Papaver armeniacum]|nr:hypothetical protein MKW92_006515 [Papaver armeniacum]